MPETRAEVKRVRSLSGACHAVVCAIAEGGESRRLVLCARSVFSQNDIARQDIQTSLASSGASVENKLRGHLGARLLQVIVFPGYSGEHDVTPHEWGISMPAFSNWKQPLIGILLFVVFFLLVAMLIGVWPIYQANSTETLRSTWFLNRAIGTNLDVRLFVVVALAGALGSSIQAAKSFARHMGDGDFNDNWVAASALRC